MELPYVYSKCVVYEELWIAENDKILAARLSRNLRQGREKQTFPNGSEMNLVYGSDGRSHPSPK